MRMKPLIGMLLLMMAAQAGAQTKPISGVISAHPAASTTAPVNEIPRAAATHGNDEVCHGLGTQGGQYTCYTGVAVATVDCMMDRYLNETPVAQMCGLFELPVNMQKPQSGTVTLSISSKPVPVSSKKK